MSKVDDPNRPLWPTFQNIPIDVWNIYYQGLSDRWILGSNCYSLETAERMACLFDRPTKILHFQLVEEFDINNNQLRKKYKRPPIEAKPKIKIRKPKVVTRVRMPKKEK